MKWYNYVYWARRHFILSCVSAKKCWSSASEREWWCRSADEHQWTCVHRVWAPTNTAKREWASCNGDKACGFHTNAATEPPLDQSWSYCCRKWAQLSVSWRTTAVIPWKWKQNRQNLWRSSAVLKLAVSRRFSNKNRQCAIVAIPTIEYNWWRSTALHDGQIFYRRSTAEVLNISKLPYGHRRYWRPVALGGIHPRLCLRFVALNCVHSRFLNRRWAPTKTANV